MSALTSGARLGPYEIVSALGAGGMGEVYRARDTKLGRDVALKVLPESFAADPDRLMRFEREAKTLASLNHPHIAQIHGFEQSGNTSALVMELVDGEDLSQRISRGAIPIDEALPIAKQIAEALEAAHEQGIIHRDLKPANIKVRPDGTVKVLDFGLAKALDQGSGIGDRGSEGVANSPTITSPAMTMQGVILGTAAYMAPEQAKGKAVDRRADIWAFGCVLYEMLAGSRAFDGEDTTEILGAIVKGEPDWSRLPANVPPPVAALLKRCLRKSRPDRLDSAAAVRIAIEDADATPGVIGRRGIRVYAVAAMVAAIALLMGWAGGRMTSPAAAPPSTDTPIVADIPAPPGAISAFYDGFALSPDAAILAFTARAANGVRHLWLRRIGAAVAQQMAGTDAARYPFWSPDGQHIAFFVGPELRRIPLAGGTPQVLGEATPTGSWSERDEILYANLNAVNAKVRSLSAGSGGRRELLAGNRPQWLPGGTHFLFMAGSFGQTQLGIADAATHAFSIIKDLSPSDLDRGFGYAQPGFVFFNRTGALMAQRFDQPANALIGDPFVIAGEVGSPRGWFAMSAAGDTLVALARRSPDQRGDPGDPIARLEWVDRSGSTIGPVGDPGRYWVISISPDGQRILAREDDSLWLFGGRSPVRLRTPGGNVVWSPDGRDIVYFETGSLIRRTLATQSDTTLATVQGLTVPTDWSPDGQSLLLTLSDGSSSDLVVVDAASGRIRPLVASASTERQARYSSGGEHVAYSSDVTGRFEVFVMPLDGSRTATQVSDNGGQHPMWRADGGELFYLGPAGELMAVSASRNDRVMTFGKPVRLFQRPLNDITSVNMPPYAVSPDGQRFLLNVPGEPSSLLYIRGFDRLQRSH